MEIRKLNTLRGVAALIVAVSHYFSSATNITHFMGGRSGQLGVMIFFILSGFLMSYLYLNRSFSRLEVEKFVIARIARVIPLYLVVVIASFLLSINGYPEIAYPISDIYSLLSHVLLLSGVSVLWTVPAEIHFYLSFVAFWFLYKHRPALLWPLLACAYGAVIASDYRVIWGEIFGLDFAFTIVRSLPYFLVGLMFGQLYTRWSAPNYLKKHWMVVSLPLILVLYPGIFACIFGIEHGMWRDPRVFLAMSAIFFIFVFLVPDNNRLVCNRVGDFLGKTSYSLYLLHLPVLHYMPENFSQYNAWFILPAYIAACLIVSSVSFRLIEDPLRRGIRNLAPAN